MAFNINQNYTNPPPGSQFGYDASVNEGTHEDFLNRLIRAIYPGALNSAYFSTSWGQPAAQQSTLDQYNLTSPEGARARTSAYGRGAMENAQTFGRNAASQLRTGGFSQSSQQGAILDALNQGRAATSDYGAKTADPYALAQQRYQIAQQAGVSPSTQMFSQLLGGATPSQQPGPSIWESLLGGLGAAGGLGWKPFSDRSLKSNVKRVGTHKLGIGIYEYDIFGKREKGVMADEVAQIVPEAVLVDEHGFQHVDYSKIGGI